MTAEIPQRERVDRPDLSSSALLEKGGEEEWTCGGDRLGANRSAFVCLGSLSFNGKSAQKSHE